MATRRNSSKDTPETEAPDAVGTVQMEPIDNRDTRVPTKRARVKGKLATPRYMIHHGAFSVTVPAVAREYVENDPESENFGEVLTEEEIPETIASGQHAKDTRFGGRKVRIAHMITDAAEAAALEARGFVDATDKEIEAASKLDRSTSTDVIAAQQRVEAERKFRRATSTGLRGAVDDDE